MSTLIKIQGSEIASGQPVEWNIYDKDGVLLLRKGFVITSLTQMSLVVSRGYYHEPVVESPQPDGTVSLPPLHTDEEYAQPFVLKDWSKKDAAHYAVLSMEDAMDTLEPILQDIARMYPAPDLQGELMGLADALHKAVRLHLDICLASVFLSRVDTKNYRVRHAVDTAIITIIIALHLGFSRHEIARTTAAAFTMNIGMWFQQNRLAKRVEPLDEELTQVIFDHPLNSVILLRKAGITDPLWLEDVLTHHEKIDGSGYPLGMVGSDIPTGSQIIGLADRYTAMLAPRGNRDALLPSQALRILLFAEGDTIEARLSGILTKIVGIYPPGTFVRLRNKDIAVVMSVGRDGATPAVKSVLGANRKLLGVPVLRDSADEKYAITGTVNLQQDEIPFSVRKIWQIDE